MPTDTDHAARIAEIRRQLEAATNGFIDKPWETDAQGMPCHTMVLSGILCRYWSERPPSEDHGARFLENVKSDVAYLLDRVAELEHQLGEPTEPTDILTAFDELAAASGDTWDGVDAQQYVRDLREADRTTNGADTMTMPHLMNCDHSPDGWCLECVKSMYDALTAELALWKNAILDAAVVGWVYKAEHETDPRAAINDLLCRERRMALDPSVSEEAKKLHDRIAELTAELARRDGERTQAERGWALLNSMRHHHIGLMRMKDGWEVAWSTGLWRYGDTLLAALQAAAGETHHAD